MSDTNENGQIESEGQTDEPMPSSEQPADDAQEEEVEQEETPEQVKSRTAEQFEKLKATNRELSEKLKALEGSKPSHSSVLDELRPNMDTVPQATVPNAESQQFVDEGGYIDTALLNSTVTGVRKAAEEAKQTALQTQKEIQRFQESQVMQAVHKDFPEMDPNNQDQFDPSFYDYVKNDLIGQAFQGKEDVRAAALKARQILGKKQATTPEQGKETISSRGQASAPTGTATKAPEKQNREALVQGTFKGDKEAIFERLQASGH